MTAEELAAIKALRAKAESACAGDDSFVIPMFDAMDALIAEVERLRTKELWRPYFRATIKLAGRPLVIRYFESEAEATAYIAAFRETNAWVRGPAILREHIERSDAWASEP